MELTPEPSTQITAQPASRLTTRTFLALLAIAVFAGLLHMVPFWRAQTQTAPGFIFTGNINNSPDLMQYRVWERQALESGLLVTDKFTSEPNEPHLLVIFYYVIAKLGAFFSVPFEFVYSYMGALFAFFFVIVLFLIVRRFIPAAHQYWWVFLVALFGGGFGAYIRVLSNVGFVRNNFLLNKVLVEGYWSWPTLFEAYRGNYIINSIFDTHFILMWLLSSLSVFLFYLTLRRFSWLRLALTTFFFGLTTLIHVYDGITLGVIAFFVVLLLWKRKQAPRFTYLSLLFSEGAILISVLLFFLLYRRSGLAVPDWRGINILFSILLISYPLAWFVIFPGIVKFWQNARFEETFLIGWALGCLVLTLAGPYYPYPDRGTMTLQIPLYIIAGLIFFRYFNRVTWYAGLVIIVVAGMTPAWVLQHNWEIARFDPSIPSIWLNADHEAIIHKLDEIAAPDDILITDMSKVDWEVDPLWLAPDYPGKFYCAHFFLTVDFTNKRDELVKFYDPLTTSQEQSAFLKEKHIRFVYVDANQNPSRFSQIPGLTQVLSNSVGAIFQFDNQQQSQ